MQTRYSSDPLCMLPRGISSLRSVLDTPENLLEASGVDGKGAYSAFLTDLTCFWSTSDLIHHPSFQTHSASLPGLRKRLDREGVRKPWAESGFLLHFQF